MNTLWKKVSAKIDLRLIAGCHSEKNDMKHVSQVSCKLNVEDYKRSNPKSSVEIWGTNAHRSTLL